MPTSETRNRATLASSVDESAFRTVLSHFGSGVVAVTASSADGGPVGMTCQAFISVSLEPALIAFCPARTSTTWPKIERSGAFCVNVLAADQLAVCRQLSRSGTDKFAGISYTRSPGGAPRLAGAIAWIDCAVSSVLDGGDHHLVVGAVQALGVGDMRREPLLFYRSGFGSFVPLIQADAR